MRLAGHHDRVIEAWTQLYDDVLILRYEDLMQSSEVLCKWLKVFHVPFPPKRVNESHAGLARLHRRLPFMSSLPHGVKSVLKPLTRLLPGKHQPILTMSERQMIRETYESSNQRTEALLARRSGHPPRLNTAQQR